MPRVPQPPDEYVRLMNLAQYGILDTLPEASFDRITRLAALLLHTPIAAINFVDQFRQWSKSAVGVPDTNSSRDDSFCAWTILQDTPMVVENASVDPRFAENPMVTGGPHIHMYAGAPLVTPAGHRVGSLCVIDDRPHPLTSTDLQALQDLADLVVSELELRVRNEYLSRTLGAKDQFLQDMQRSLKHAQVLESVNELMDFALSPEDMTLSASALIGEALQADYTGLLRFEGKSLRIEAGYQHPRVPAVVLDVPNQLPSWPQSVTRTLRDATAPLYLDDYPAHPRAIKQVVDAGIQ
ncbi:GAF domain-containing protein [Deinococcus hopiensis]|uniref:GAF domain-containing protein n=1 Tax=Deinococcus hopiensis TaxID=309885 RepID=UPI001FE7C6AC|nr:GAF domain-containing protein [Deinococcus hopiensis]